MLDSVNFVCLLSLFHETTKDPRFNVSPLFIDLMKQ